MQNGTRKGAGAQAMPTMRTSPGLEDIWQLHWSYGAGIEQNSAGVFIANVEDNATIAGILTAPPRGAVRAVVGRRRQPAVRRRRRRRARWAPGSRAGAGGATAGTAATAGRRPWQRLRRRSGRVHIR